MVAQSRDLPKKQNRTKLQIVYFKQNYALFRVELSKAVIKRMLFAAFDPEPRIFKKLRVNRKRCARNTYSFTF